MKMMTILKIKINRKASPAMINSRKTKQMMTWKKSMDKKMMNSKMKIKALHSKTRRIIKQKVITMGTNLINWKRTIKMKISKQIKTKKGRTIIMIRPKVMKAKNKPLMRRKKKKMQRLNTKKSTKKTQKKNRRNKNRTNKIKKIKKLKNRATIQMNLMQKKSEWIY